MNSYQLSPRATKDLFEIWNYIAQDNIEAADRVESAIRGVCGLLATSPLIGSVRRDLTHSPVRFWTVQRYPNYRIIYDPTTLPIRIVRILHSSRNVPHLLT